MFYINKDKDSYNLTKDEILHISKDDLRGNEIIVRIVFKQVDNEGKPNYLDIEALNSIQEADDFIEWLSISLQLYKDLAIRQVYKFYDFSERSKDKELGRYFVI